MLLAMSLERCRSALLSSHLFSNHKGGCGKTTILFHTCAEYARRHKDDQVLVIDTTLRGDLSELLLGGDKGASGKQAVKALAHLRSTTKLFHQAAAIHAAEGVTYGTPSSTIRAALGKILAKEGKDADGDDSLLDIDKVVL